MKIYVDIYLAKNLGDDLFIHILAKRFPTVEFVVNYYGNEYDEFFSKYNNLKKSQYPLRYKILNRLKLYDYINDANRISTEYDALIFLGGSIFREENYWKELYSLRNKMLQMFKKKKKPVYVLGANFGPCKSKVFLKSYNQFFEACDDVCFREFYSRNMFQELSNVRNEADIVFQLEVKKTGKKDNIIYSVIDPEHKEGLMKYREKYIDSIIKSIIHNVSVGYKCTLLSFCEGEGDLKVCEEIFAALPTEIGEKTIIVSYNDNIDEILKIISEGKLFIASRFHANILGLISGTKILPLVYSAKTSNVLKEIGFNNPIIKIEESEQILKEDWIKQNADSEFQLKNSTKIYESAKRQFQVLEEMLSKKRVI